MERGPEDLLLCDLDGTLLVSAADAREGDIPVETVRGEVRSYLPEAVAGTLEELSGRLRLVPVTSRSAEQYLRIDWPEAVRPAYAAVANGGLLLEHGRPAADWPVSGPDPDTLERVAAELVPYGGLSRVVDGSYAYLHAPPELDLRSVHVRLSDGFRAFRTGRKLYLLPPGVSKEAAAGHLIAMFRPGLSFAAGDCAMDLDMLAMADTAMVPEGRIGGMAPFGALECLHGMRFPEFIAATAAKYY